jgi:NADPH2:quinone reductase
MTSGFHEEYSAVLMKAALLSAPGAVPAPADFPEPVASDAEHVVKVAVAGLNPVDLLAADGALGRAPETPCVVGREGVGETATGERVYFGRSVSPFGSAAEWTLVAKSDLVELPDDVHDDAAVALGTAGTAAWLALADAARLKPGETVIVLGSGGVVGQVAVQAARIMGAARVAAVTRNPVGSARDQDLRVRTERLPCRRSLRRGHVSARGPGESSC